MSTLIYRFDNPDRFPVLESLTTANRALVSRRGDERAVLWVTAQRRKEDPAEVQVVLALPPVGIDGTPERFELELLGDAGGAEIILDASDATETAYTYSFGTVTFHRAGTLATDVQSPSHESYSDERAKTPVIVPPIQLFRLAITMGLACDELNVGLRALLVTGSVQLVPTGISDGNPFGDGSPAGK